VGRTAKKRFFVILGRNKLIPTLICRHLLCVGAEHGGPSPPSSLYRDSNETLSTPPSDDTRDSAPCGGHHDPTRDDDRDRASFPVVSRRRRRRRRGGIPSVVRRSRWGSDTTTSSAESRWDSEFHREHSSVLR
jgi:hypothetical protein